MANNFVQPGHVLDHTLAADAGAGDLIVIGARVGVALDAGLTGEVVSLQVRGVFTLPKLGTDVIAQGALVYWDSTPGEITTTVGSNVLAGYAAAAAGNGVTTVAVDLNG